MIILDEGLLFFGLNYLLRILCFVNVFVVGKDCRDDLIVQ